MLVHSIQTSQFINAINRTVCVCTRYHHSNIVFCVLLFQKMVANVLWEGSAAHRQRQGGTVLVLMTSLNAFHPFLVLLL